MMSLVSNSPPRVIVTPAPDTQMASSSKRFITHVPKILINRPSHSEDEVDEVQSVPSVHRVPPPQHPSRVQGLPSYKPPSRTPSPSPPASPKLPLRSRSPSPGLRPSTPRPHLKPVLTSILSSSAEALSQVGMSITNQASKMFTPGGEGADVPQMTSRECDAIEDQMTEDELRATFENEEIERFLSVFRRRVNEVTLAHTHDLIDPSLAPTPQVLPPKPQTNPPVPKVVVVEPQDVDKLESITSSLSAATTTSPTNLPQSAQIAAAPDSVATVLPLSASKPIHIPDEEEDSLGSSGSNLDESSSEEEDEECEDGDEDKEEHMWIHIQPEDCKTPTGEEIKIIKDGNVEKKLKPKQPRPTPVWPSEVAAKYVARHLPYSHTIQSSKNRRRLHRHRHHRHRVGFDDDLTTRHAPRFTLGSLRAAFQRVYMALYPFYMPLLANAWDVSRWVDWWRSAKWFCVFWYLWYYNLLPAAFCLVITYTLLKHHFLPYPTVAQLRRRRAAAQQAQRLSAVLTRNVGLGLAAGANPSPGSGEVGLMDLWRFVMCGTGVGHALGGSGGKDREVAVDPRMMAVGLDEEASQGSGDGAGAGAMEGGQGQGKMAQGVMTGEKQTKKEVDYAVDDWRRLMVVVLEEIADFHERAKNILLWRKPASTWVYTYCIAGASIVCLVLPPHLLMKLWFAILGSIYWFVIPTICAMDRKQRARIPPPFWDVPTDAECAMELISARVARGESVVPAKRGVFPNRHNNTSYTSLNSATTANGSVMSPHTRFRTKVAKGLGINHHTGGSKMMLGSTSFADGSSSVNGGEDAAASIRSQTQIANVEDKSYMGYRKTVPGRIILSSTSLSFTPIFRHSDNNTSHGCVEIPLDRVRGVKKIRRWKGISIRFLEPVKTPDSNTALSSSDNPVPPDWKTVTLPSAPHSDNKTANGGAVPAVVMVEREEKFRWVSSRDDLFARIVGWGGRNWVTL